MKRYLAFGGAIILVCGVAALAGAIVGRATAADDAQPTAPPASGATILSHDLYFALKDNSPESQQKLIDACKKYLSPHEGIVRFTVGTLSDIKGAFNDRNYDVVCQIDFVDRAALGTYAKTKEHQQFIAECSSMFKGLRIFDSMVEQVTPAK
ncbi:MAG: Dabb family protein [Planctomycetaceae bacterium]|nr:Dabb family protein [Planctomycetaceae bacterium]